MNACKCLTKTKSTMVKGDHLGCLMANGSNAVSHQGRPWHHKRQQQRSSWRPQKQPAMTSLQPNQYSWRLVKTHWEHSSKQQINKLHTKPWKEIDTGSHKYEGDKGLWEDLTLKSKSSMALCSLSVSSLTKRTGFDMHWYSTWLAYLYT